MSKTERQLRFVQLACGLVLVICVLLIYLGIRRRSHASPKVGPTQGIVILLALWSAISGFRLQRILQYPDQRTSPKTSPLNRWRAGHLFRLWSAMAVGLWGLVLYGFHGPLWIADVLLGAGVVLLLIWTPGASPGEDNRVAGGSGK